MRAILIACLFTTCLAAGCGDDGAEADRLGVGATCTSPDQCIDAATCLTNFKGGYCGLVGCTHDIDCPEASACIAHDDGMNYCFRICIDKPDCNANRPVEDEANCSSSAVFVDGTMGRKACVPPSSGI